MKMKMHNVVTLDADEQEVCRDLIGIQAQIAALAEQEKLLKASLVRGGPRTIKVEDYATDQPYTVTVTEESVTPKKVTDWEAVAKKLKPSVQLVTAHTSVKETRRAPSVRVYGPRTK